MQSNLFYPGYYWQKLTCSQGFFYQKDHGNKIFILMNFYFCEHIGLISKTEIIYCKVD